ncbi:MAG: PQQ-binding-like beta-propeller repeat protein [Bacteroidia bacterium]|nr:PQQ-binding-like beta-propeller repeat protein [Bacteroidia bacterium]
MGNDKKTEILWESDIPATNDLIKAGNCLYAADSTGITAIKISDNKPLKIWSIHPEQKIERLVAANRKLIAVSDQGDILVYGENEVSPVQVIDRSVTERLEVSEDAEKIVPGTGLKDGYGVVIGARDKELLEELVSGTSMSIIAFDRDSSRIASLREYFDGLGVKADRLCFLHMQDDFPLLPKYFSSLTIITDPDYLNDFDSITVKSIFESARPYDGKIWIRNSKRGQKRLLASLKNIDLYGAEYTAGRGYSLISRTGALEGTDSWTHNYGDIANTIKSDDKRVKAPLGILWFGGNSNLDVLPRHGHGPGEQVIDGRLIIEGMNSISARDVYTGRVLWERKFEKLIDDNWMVFYDETYDGEDPLDTKYNQVHLPGANARGTNFIATREYVYVIENNLCHLIDIRSGDLILGNDFADFPEIRDPDEKVENRKFTDYNLTASRELVILDRFSGERLWSVSANQGFIHNSIICGRDILFCLDKLPQNLETKLRRRGEPTPSGSRLLYIDIKTGKILNEERKNIFGTWLSYSGEYNYLLQATRPSRDMLTGESGNRMIVYDITTGKEVWDKHIKYNNPPILHGIKIYTEGEGFSLLTGEPLLEEDPLTGEERKWGYKREYGCGIVVASEHLLTFRSASAGFVNLDLFDGTGSLGGWKSGCSANLIVADGVLNSPDYTRTCQCPYQNQTSLALINMPWMTYWANSNYKWSGKKIRKLGLNLNAPGDRISDKDVLWIECPAKGGGSAEIPIRIDTSGYKELRKDPLSVISESTPWISASAICGMRSIEITLSDEKETNESTYNIKLYFSELENMNPGERIFDVTIQDSKVLDDFDIVSQAGKKDSEIIKSFSGIKAGKTIRIGMFPEKGNTILSGIEITEENANRKLTVR